MDVAYYISDLLQQQGELSVPNLGYFVQIRVSAHYNEAEQKFYPPRYGVHFDPQVIDDDDSLATYITGLKNISLASAKYFIEKYISGLKEHVIVEDVPFANLGSFSSDGIKLVFKPADYSSSPDFFGTPIIDVHKGQGTITTSYHNENAEVPLFENTEEQETTTVEPESVYEPIVNEVSEAPVIPPIVNLPLTEEDTEPDAEFEYEAPRKFFNFWTITIMILAAIAISLFTLYKLRPGMFGWYFSLQKNPYIINHLPAKPKKDTTAVQMPAIKPDSTATDSALNKPADTIANSNVTTPINKALAPDTVVVKTKAKKAAPAKTVNTKPVVTTPQPVNTVKPATNAGTAVTNDVVPKGSWVIYAGASPIRRSVEKMIVNYKSMGFTQARLLTTKVGPGGNFKIIMGAYATHAEAEDARKELMLTGKFKQISDLSVEQIKK